MMIAASGFMRRVAYVCRSPVLTPWLFAVRQGSQVGVPTNITSQITGQAAAGPSVQAFSGPPQGPPGAGGANQPAAASASPSPVNAPSPGAASPAPQQSSPSPPANNAPSPSPAATSPSPPKNSPAGQSGSSGGGGGGGSNSQNPFASSGSPQPGSPSQNSPSTYSPPDFGELTASAG